MLAIARALMSRPKLLLCDEPRLGLAPLITQELFAIIAAAERERRASSVLLVEQNANLALDDRRPGLRARDRHASSPPAPPSRDRRRRQRPQGVPGVLTWTASSTAPLPRPVHRGDLRAGRPRPRRRLPRHRPPQLRPGRDGAPVGVHHRDRRRSSIPLLHWVIPLWFATLVGMAFGFAPRGEHRGDHRAPAQTTVAARRVRRHDRAVPRHQRPHHRCSGARRRTRLIGSLFPNDPDRLRAPVRHRLAVPATSARSSVTLVITGLLFLLFQKTRFGLAMRAVASNPESGRLVGIPTGVMLAASWGIAGALGALGGTLLAAGNRAR